jgi:hypothetical protein
MTTTTPIPASLAAEVAARDRRRLNVLDAILADASPETLHRLLDSARDLCAAQLETIDSLRQERVEREAAIGAAVERIATAEAETERLTERLTERRTAQRAEIERLESRVDELEAEIRVSDQRLADHHDTWKARGTSLESERTEWIAAAVDVGAALGGSLGPVAGTSGTIDPREWIRYAQGLARDVRKLTARVAELEALAPSHPVYMPLPAQDRAEELIRSILSERKAMMSYAVASLDDRMSGTWASEWINATRAALTSLGAPTTTPSAAPGLVAAVSEEELACAWFNVHGGDVKPSDIDDRDRAHVRAILARLNATTIVPVDPVTLPAISPDAAEFLIDKMQSYGWASLGHSSAVDDLRRAIAAMLNLAPPPAAAPGPVLAGVSEGDIACIAANAHRECIDGSPWMAVARAVVARLDAAVVAPVDPAKVVAMYLSMDGSNIAAMSDALTAHNIPVTPEAGK